MIRFGATKVDVGFVPIPVGLRNLPGGISALKKTPPGRLRKPKRPEILHCLIPTTAISDCQSGEFEEFQRRPERRQAFSSQP
jgi:hypothetical protein